MVRVRSDWGRRFVMAILLAGLLVGCGAGSPPLAGQPVTPAASKGTDQIAPPPTSQPAGTAEPVPAKPSAAKPLFLNSTQAEPAGQAFPPVPVLVYVGRDQSGNKQVYAVGGDLQSPVPVLPAGEATTWHSVSDDGKWLVYVRNMEASGKRVCVLPTADGRRQCFDYKGTLVDVKWRPGTDVLYVTVPEGTFLINPGTETALSPDSDRKGPVPEFSPDGKWAVGRLAKGTVLYSLDHQKKNVSLGAGSLTGWLGPQTVLAVQGEQWFIQTVQEQAQPERFALPQGLLINSLPGSPDGRWLAGLVKKYDARSDLQSIFQPGPLELQLYDRTSRAWAPAMEAGSPRTLAPNSKAALEGWSDDGRYVAVAIWDGQVLCYEPATGTWSNPVPAFPVGNEPARWSQRGAWMALPVFDGPQREHRGIAVIDAATAKAMLTVMSEESRPLWLAGPSN